MINRHLLRLLALALAGTASAAIGADRSGDEAMLRSYTQQLLDAIAPGDKGPWEKLLAPGYFQMDEEGTLRTKEQLLKELRPLPPGLTGQLRVDEFKVVFDGNVALVAHVDQEQLDYHGQMLRSRFRSFDTWQRGNGGWRLLGQHAAAVLKDPPAVHVPWTDNCAYAGRYRLTAAIEVTIRCTPQGLVAEREGRPPAAYSMEAADVFFLSGQPRTRRIFEHDGGGAVTGFVDRREGEDVRWTKVG